MNNLPRQFLSAPPPQDFMVDHLVPFISALWFLKEVLLNLASSTIPHEYEGIFLSHPSRLMTIKYLAEVRQKNLLLKCAEPPPPPLFNKMVVDYITTTATRHSLNDIWIHRSQKYFKKFPCVFSAVFAPRLSEPPPPPRLSLSQVDCIDPTLIFIDLRTLYTVSSSHPSLFLFQFRNDRI